MWNMQAGTDGSQCVHKFTLYPRSYPSWWWTLQEFFWQRSGYLPSKHQNKLRTKTLALTQANMIGMLVYLSSARSVICGDSFCRFKLNYQEVSELRRWHMEFHFPNWISLDAHYSTYPSWILDTPLVHVANKVGMEYLPQCEECQRMSRQEACHQDNWIFVVVCTLLCTVSNIHEVVL